MKFIIGLFLLCTGAGVFAKSTSKGRDGRWLRNTYTETKVQKEIMTSLVPSSCVHVEPTLPACRGIRNLETFPEFVGSQVYPEYMKGRQLIMAENKGKVILAPVNQTKSVSWGEYLGLVAPTVTVTSLKLETKTVLDPRTVVTFSVKGCRPSKLPLGLDRCPISNTMFVEEILPSSVIPTQVIPTATLQENGKRSKNIEVEPSSVDDLSNVNLSAVPTEALSDVEIKAK